ncbi:MAG: hypothetical protein GX847_02495 [Clostridiales bacterium]|nr:hypothetical protein [Clostridiales bacterium]
MNRRIPYSPNELRVVDTLPGFFGGPMLTDAFTEGVYIRSREIFSR